MQIVTPKGELAYVHVFKPQPAQEGYKEQYSVTFIWDEDNPKLAKLKAAIVEVAKKKWGAKAEAMLNKGQLRNPIRPGSDREGSPDEADYAGKVFLTARSSDKPQAVDEDLEEFMGQMDLYSGCQGRGDIYFFPYDKAGNKGVGAILNSVQKLGDGERKSGRRPASSAFADLDDDDADLM
jgi:hypothetical protein